MMDVVYEDNHLLVVIKPVNVPMQADCTGDLDLLNEAKAYIKEKYHKPGDVYLGLVHRLDRPVGGLCVFARTSKAASRLSESIRNGSFHKEYDAVVYDHGLRDEGEFKDRLWKDGKRNMTFVNPKGKESALRYKVLKRKGDWALVHIELLTGRSHQIRVQFSSRNHPLYGDQKYNSNAKVGQQIALFAADLSFPHPTTKEIMHFHASSKRAPFTDMED